MTVLRPVASRIPAKSSILSETNIPLGFVLTPYNYGDTIPSKRTSNGKTTSTLPVKEHLLARCNNCSAPATTRANRNACTLCGNPIYTAVENHCDARARDGKPDFTKSDTEDYERRYPLEFFTRRTIVEESHGDRVTEYSLPFFEGRTREVADGRRGLYSVPAGRCPPLLILLIDVTSTSTHYYQELSRSLHVALFGDDVHRPRSYRGTKVGIFLMSSGGGLSVLHLDGRVGHVKHTTVRAPPLRRSNGGVEPGIKGPPDEMIVPLADVVRMEDVFVALEGVEGRNRVETVLHDLEDSTLLVRKACRRRSGTDGGGGGGGGVALGSTIRCVLQFMDDVGCCHPGVEEENAVEDNGEDGRRSFVPYAGGKIMCFLAGPPVEIGTPSIHANHGRKGRMGTGGFGGTCAEMGKRFDIDEEHNPAPTQHEERREDDINDPELGRAGNTAHINNDHILQKQDYNLPPTAYEKVDAYFHELGIDCADAALGVEIFAMLKEPEQLLHKLHFQELGINCADAAILKQSEGPVQEVYFGFPLLRLLSDRSGGCGPLLVPIVEEGHDRDRTSDVFVKELIARSPWHRPTAFGALLRIHLSSGLTIDKSTDDSGGSAEEKYYKTAGLYGSVSLSASDDELYCMGSCDPLSTLCFSVTKTEQLGIFDDDSHHEHYTERPCVQTCFAYTAVVEHNGDWITVRRLRVLTYSSLKIAKDAEDFTSSIDTNALAVNLFHRFYFLSLRHGLLEVQSIAQEWLILTLLLLYRSAKRHNDQYRRRANNLLLAGRIIGVAGSDLSDDEILLGKGHRQLRELPLLIFSLLQCDAIRPNEHQYNPSIDARCAAAANITTMPPETLHRCITPRLDLWLNNGDEEALSKDLERSWVGIEELVVDQVGIYHREEEIVDDVPGPLLLVDSPRNILIYDYHDVCQLHPSDTIRSDALKEYIKRITQGYRVPPLTYPPIGQDMTIARSYLKDTLIEDAVSGGCFRRWCSVEVVQRLNSLIQTENKIDDEM